MKHEWNCATNRPSIFYYKNPCTCGAWDGVFLRWAMFIAALGLFLIAVASFAVAQPTGCSTIVDVVKMAQEMGGSARPLTASELNFSRGLFAAQPNTPMDYPEGDGGLMLVYAGKMIIAFARGGKVCEMMSIGPDGKRNFERIVRGPGEPS